ncbi:MAG: hypothetical protein EXR99_13565 [Gemmataceae bacterium]|nr:hypothetical protein [Gemmataceae bacterium]
MPDRKNTITPDECGLAALIRSIFSSDDAKNYNGESPGIRLAAFHFLTRPTLPPWIAQTSKLLANFLAAGLDETYLSFFPLDCKQSF